MVDLDVVGCISGSHDDVKGPDESMVDVEACRLSQVLFLGTQDHRTSSDTNSDSCMAAFSFLIFVDIRGTRYNLIWEKPKPETSLYLQ